MEIKDKIIQKQEEIIDIQNKMIIEKDEYIILLKQALNVSNNRIEEIKNLARNINNINGITSIKIQE